MSAPIQVLVVDDEPAVARAYAQFIAGRPGFDCVGTADGIAGGLAVLERRRVDLILLDLAVSDARGLDGLRRLRGAGHVQDVIVVTSSRDARSVRGAGTWGAVDYLAKPFTAAELRVRLEAYREFRQRAASAQDLDQRGIDELLRNRPVGDPRPARAESAAPMGAAPKGIDAGTLDAVRSALRDGETTAAAAAAATGLSRVTARRYLDHLVELGALETRRDYSTGGRPAIVYRRP